MTIYCYVVEYTPRAEVDPISWTVNQGSYSIPAGVHAA